ncbi:hypothetical protein ANN_14428 [Periplaneta americana]|uniref:Uncharacterized protein n=1 Tax=Periplaneta americana TaxID=6978 RepID=A0ABQ8SXI9_PERAM|nr:hypothetical protein ANN_14428 [Periplaneta americana]
MWIWRRMERVKWIERIRNEAVLERVGGKRMMLKMIRKRKRNWLGHWLRRHCLLTDALQGMVNGRLRWAGHVARMGESRIAYRVVVGRPEVKRPLGRSRRRWEDNIKMDLREVGYDDRDWINLSHDRDRWRAYVRAAMNLRVLYKPFHFSQKNSNNQGKESTDRSKIQSVARAGRIEGLRTEKNFRKNKIYGSAITKRGREKEETEIRSQDSQEVEGVK